MSLDVVKAHVPKTGFGFGTVARRISHSLTLHFERSDRAHNIFAKDSTDSREGGDESTYILTIVQIPYSTVVVVLQPAWSDALSMVLRVYLPAEFIE